MKTNQIILISSVAVLLLFILSSFRDQASGPKYLTVKTIEFWSGVYDSKITVVDENGRAEEFELEKLRSKNLSDNVKKINTVLNALSQKGYALVNSTSSGWGQDGVLNTFIFEKK